MSSDTRGHYQPDRLQREVSNLMGERNQCVLRYQELGISSNDFIRACEELEKRGQYKVVQGCIFIRKDYYQNLKKNDK